MSDRRPLSLAAVLLTALACAPSMLPGSKIADTQENRDLLAVFNDYRNAFEARDAAALDRLASPRYLDARDSVSKATLQTELAKDFAKVKDVHLDVNVRGIAVEGDEAHIDYFYSEAFLLNAPDATWQRESDDKRMTFVRDPKAPHGWLVTSGF